MKKNNKMKRFSLIEIYNIIAIIIIIGLSISCYKLYHDLRDTEEVLQQCDGRYYELLQSK